MDVNSWLRNRTWIIWYKRSPSGAVNLVWDIQASESFIHNGLSIAHYRERAPFNNRHGLRFSTSRTTVTDHLEFASAVPSYPLLQFCTLAVHYSLSMADIFGARAYIIDNRERRCGCVFLDGYEENIFFVRKGPFEFVVLSESYQDYTGNHLMDSVYLSPTQSHDPWDFYSILLLEWDKGVAERRGVGVMIKSAVEFSLPPGPVWKEIVLG